MECPVHKENKIVALYAAHCFRGRLLHSAWRGASAVCRPRMNHIQQLKAMLALIDVIECAAPMQDDGDPHFVPVMP